MEARNAENSRYGELGSANPPPDSGFITSTRRTSRERVRAIAAIGPLRVSGFPAWLLWLVVHLVALTGFNNRLSVLFNWGIAFFSQGRPQRVATAQQVFGRYALEAQAAAAGHSGQIDPFVGWDSMESNRKAEPRTSAELKTPDLRSTNYIKSSAAHSREHSHG